MRLIDADEVMREQCGLFCTEEEAMQCRENECLCTIGLVLQHAKTEDPVRHGKWLLDETTGESVCSLCFGVCAGLIDFPIKSQEGRHLGWALQTPPYCSRCGAKMDAGEIQEHVVTEEDIDKLTEEDVQADYYKGDVPGRYR